MVNYFRWTYKSLLQAGRLRQGNLIELCKEMMGYDSPFLLDRH